MRTKTLALSTLLGALGSATSLLAQVNVYSINAVGYINVTLPPGYSILTCPLIVTGGNTLNNLFPQTANGYVPGSGPSPLWNSTVAVFSGGHFTSGDSISYSGGWNSGGTITINPGQAVFFQNPNTLGTGANISATFVGTVPQNGQYNMTNSLVPGYNLVGSIVPVTGSYISPIINLTNALGSFDTIAFYNPAYNGAGGQLGYQFEIQGSYSKGWGGGPGANGEPVSTNVTQGFFYYNATAGGPTGGYPETSSNEFWVENFTINP